MSRNGLNIAVLLAAMSILAVGCNGEEDIPDRVEKPEKEKVFNDLGFTPHKQGDPYDSYEGLVMAGYQGWFGTPGDGCVHATHSNTKWYHYRENDMFKPGVLQNSIDFWPDCSEYEITYETEFTMPDGSPARVFSSYDESTVDVHFKWMQEYGIDGVFMQRFVGECVNNTEGKQHFNKVLQSAMKASNKYQRAICVMYDLGGFEPSKKNTVDAVVADTKEIVDTYNLFDREAAQKYYLYENGKPLIVLWGVGFAGKKEYSTADVTQLVEKLQEMGFSIMLGVPTYWREGRNDTESGVALKNLIKKVDVIMPWFVGRYGPDSYASFSPLVKSDIAWCKTNNVGYAPLCFVGSSDRNMHPNNGYAPRNGGKFFWDQASFAIKNGAKMLYIAMFDEIDEGTAIFKCLNQRDVPSNVPDPDYYIAYNNGNYSRYPITYNFDKIVVGDNGWKSKASELNITFLGVEDNLGTDHYLWITGQAGAMLRGEIELTSTIPSRK